MAGTVVASSDPDWREGDAVLATGCGLSETRDGGYSQYVRLESRAVIAQPAGLTPREAMVLGTAGFTAALALLRMQDNRQTPELGPLAVTGASGGVGALALAIFSRAGYSVHAVSGKPDQADFLRGIGATEVLPRDALAETGPLQSARFGGGLDNAGGDMLASLLAQTVPYGSVVSAGLAASPTLDMTVMPFILRGVSLLGVSSANAPRGLREEVWSRLGSDWKPQHWTASVLPKSAWMACPPCSSGCWPAARWAAPWCGSTERRRQATDGRRSPPAGNGPALHCGHYMGNNMARILIVDDSPSQLLGIQRIVEKLGHQILTATDGAAGVETAKAELPDRS